MRQIILCCSLRASRVCTLRQTKWLTPPPPPAALSLSVLRTLRRATGTKAFCCGARSFQRAKTLTPRRLACAKRCATTCTISYCSLFLSRSVSLLSIYLCLSLFYKSDFKFCLSPAFPYSLTNAPPMVDPLLWRRPTTTRQPCYL